MLAVAAYEFRQAPPIRYEMEFALISLLVESFSEHLCLDNHCCNYSRKVLLEILTDMESV